MNTKEVDDNIESLSAAIFKTIADWSKSKGIDPNGYYIGCAFGMNWCAFVGQLPPDKQAMIFHEFMERASTRINVPSPAQADERGPRN